MAENETDWQDVDLEAVDKQLKDFQERNNRQLAKKPPVGRSVFRALPPRKDRPPVPIEEVYVHFIHHPETGELMFVGECPVKMNKGNSCAPCREAARLKRTGIKEDGERAEKLAAAWHGYMSGVYLARPDKDVNPKTALPEVMDVPRSAFEDLMKAYRDPQLGGNFTHPDTGFDLIFDRTGTGKNDTKYKVQLARRQSPILNRDWLKKLPDLKLVAGQFQSDKVEALFAGKVDGATSFPPQEDPQKALPPAPQTNADGTWTHPSQQGQGQPR